MSAPTVDWSTSSPPYRHPVLAPRRRRRRRIALGVVAVIAAAVTVWLVWFSPVFSVRSVRVVFVGGPAPTGAAAAVVRHAGVPIGVPLVRVDAEAASAAVTALPWVRSVEIRRGWPAEVVLAVVPRVPVARFGEARAVDADGVVFDPLDGLDRTLITITAEGEGVRAAVGALSSLPTDLSRRVVSVRASTRDDVEFVLRSGDIVRWGSAEDGERKASVLRALLTRKAQLYDVSAPGLPTTFRPR